ncbi:MAG: BREX system P-loop protein BrxC [Thermoanaerobaculia bacterium]
MRIEKLFKKDIFRPINGVVKADQLDEDSIWQELEEFVVTRELNKHLDRFFRQYCEALDQGSAPEAAGRIGVWISGFFGSGKSHFLKVLSYLLDNEEHTHGGASRRAVDFFAAKIADPMLFADIQRAVASSTDVVLFNIDSKADRGSGRDALLGVFLRVFNELLGFSGDHAHIAHMERHLASKGRLQAFHETYRELTGSEWVEERDAYLFNRDQVVSALASALLQSPESCEKWIDNAEESFTLTIENFARWVSEYLESKGPDHRIIFLADEVGQFIGSDSHLMLNLQTITEELGTVCRGRAWVVVTSQEDIDAVLGDLSASKASDFSKIQGRFKTRLSLSSANVDEVIQERLLAKTDEAAGELERLFGKQGDILRNQLAFRNIGMTFKQVKSADDFVINYPFVPYQFQLLQKIFESIRKAGATGLHLAQGERSLLDAFQSAAKAVAGKEIGVSVPLYLFYPSIESFLDTAVKRTIDYARENASLEPFDTRVLEVLFLIRYVEEMRGNVDNLVTLCLEEIDADRLALRRRVEASLLRLESETLISRSGDNYFFLTNEERDINREIKSVEISGSDDTRLLGDLIFADLLGDIRKHRYSPNKMDFPLVRICDQHPVGNRPDGGLVVSVVSPLNDDYASFQDGPCILESSKDGGQVLILLGDHETLGRELLTYVKTEKYVRTKDDGTLPPSTKRIHRDLADENRARRERLILLLRELFADARVFVNGQRLSPKATAPNQALGEALDYLIVNTFTKMSYLEELRENPLPEIQAVLRSDDVGQQMVEVNLPKSNPKAIAEIRQYLELATKASKQIVLGELILNRFAARPYGWPPFELVLLLARLYAVGEIRFQMAGGYLARTQVYDAITTTGKWPKIVIHLRASTQPEDLQKARQLAKDVFAEMGPDGEEPLCTFIRAKAEQWQSQLTGYKSLAETGNYPGSEEIVEGLSLLRSLLTLDESNKLLARFLERRQDLLELSEHFNDLRNFYEQQRATWDQLRAAVRRFGMNRLELDRQEEASAALRRMQEILDAPSPYGLVHETEGLVGTVRQVNEALLTEGRAKSLAKIGESIAAISGDLEVAGAGEELRRSCLGPLERLRAAVGTLESRAHLSQTEGESVRLVDEALDRIQEHQAEQLALLAKEGKTDLAEVKIKPRRLIEPAKLAGAAWLETESQVDEFLAKLRAEMKSALDANERIEIR